MDQISLLREGMWHMGCFYVSLMSKTCECKLLLKHTLNFVVNLETEDKCTSILI